MSIEARDRLCLAGDMIDEVKPEVPSRRPVLGKLRQYRLRRGGVDPLQLYVSIAGLSYFYLSNNHTLSAIFGRDLMTPKARSERLSHMCEVILGYVLMS